MKSLTAITAQLEKHRDSTVSVMAAKDTDCSFLIKGCLIEWRDKSGWTVNPGEATLMFTSADVREVEEHYDGTVLVRLNWR